VTSERAQITAGSRRSCWLFSGVYRSGIKAGYLDFDQVGLCYPPPDDAPNNHRVKAQNLGAVWPTYQVAGTRCLIAAGSAGTRETIRIVRGHQRPVRKGRRAAHTGPGRTMAAATRVAVIKNMTTPAATSGAAGGNRGSEAINT
jgi:hypothetical protein